MWTPVTEPTPTASEATASAGAVVTPAPFPTPTVGSETRQAVVCTGYGEGALNVRTCPGVGCWAFFPLYEGQVVTLDGQTAHTQDGATWVHLTQPVEGWVNARYLCEVQP
ncbi:MAG TPA: SH3 domain-containing protein [Anaerolineales bacterium]|nr:SH3 domain-containing protein [Anaerolineales bacterium]